MGESVTSKTVITGVSSCRAEDLSSSVCSTETAGSPRVWASISTMSNTNPYILKTSMPIPVEE